MSDMKLSFYTNPMSRGRVVRWALEETGMQYDTIIVDYADMKSEAYLAVNPMGKVPALRHGEQLVTECAAIIAYLADTFPEAKLAPPPASRDRAAYYRWMFFTAGPVEAAITNKMLGVTVPPQMRPMCGYGSFEQVLDVLSQALQPGPYLLGEEFCAADLYLGAQLGFGMRFGSIEKRPEYEAYVSRLTARPAFKQAEQLDGPMPEQE